MSLLFSSFRAAASRPSAASCRLLPGQQLLVPAAGAITSSTTMTVRGVKTKVRIIAIQDLPNGKAYQNDVVSVAAGYARNYLIPQKFAVYATRQNFIKYQLKDPELETVEERRLRLEQEALQTDNLDLKAYDILRHYFRNKTLFLRRRVDPDDPNGMVLSPSRVDAAMVRSKISKQLKIDLEPHEKVHLLAEPLVEVEDEEGHVRSLESYLDEFGDPQVECTTQIKQLGKFVARISLSGGYSVPLRIEVVKR